MFHLSFSRFFVIAMFDEVEILRVKIKYSVSLRVQLYHKMSHENVRDHFMNAT